MSLWERAVEGSSADIVHHLTVVNKKSGDVLIIEANQCPFNKKWIFCCYLALLHWCPGHVQLCLCKLWLQPEDLMGLVRPLPEHVALNETRTKQSSLLNVTFQLLPGEHVCKWLSFLLAQGKFFSVGVSVRCCFAA